MNTWNDVADMIYAHEVHTTAKLNSGNATDRISFEKNEIQKFSLIFRSNFLLDSNKQVLIGHEKELLNLSICMSIIVVKTVNDWQVDVLYVKILVYQ